MARNSLLCPQRVGILQNWPTEHNKPDWLFDEHFYQSSTKDRQVRSRDMAKKASAAGTRIVPLGDRVVLNRAE
ncbi:MAG: hypothetical protein ACK58L_00220, partial [Planctomycetota bacterium]